MDKEIETAALQIRNDRIRVRNRFDGHIFDLRRIAAVRAVSPVIVELLENNAVADTPGNKLVRPRADRVILIITVVRRYDCGREIGKEIAVCLIQCDDDRPVIRSFYALNTGKRRCKDVAVARISAPLYGINHIVCRHFTSVVEFHTVTELEGIGGLIVADLIAFRNRGNQISLTVRLDKTLVDIVENLSCTGRDRFVRVHTVDIIRDADSYGVGLCG